MTYRWIGLFAGILMIVSVTGEYVECASADQADIVTTIVAGMEHRDTIIGSGTGSSVLAVYVRPPLSHEKGAEAQGANLGTIKGSLVEYQWAFDKPAYRQERRDILPAESAQSGQMHYIAASDGNSGYLYWPELGVGKLLPPGEPLAEVHDSEMVVLQMSVPAIGWNPSPRKYQPRFLGWETINGNRVAHLAATVLGGEVKHEWWVAPNLDFLVLREEWEPRPGHGHTAIVAEVLDSGGIHYAGEIVVMSYTIDDAGHKQVWAITDRVQSQVHLNIAVDSSLFTVNFPLGTQVVTNGQVHRVGPDIRAATERMESQSAMDATFTRYEKSLTGIK